MVTRIDALNRDRRYIVPDNDAGREQLLAAARAAVDKIRARLPAGFKIIPNEPLEVRRIPPAIESGAPARSIATAEPRRQRFLSTSSLPPRCRCGIVVDTGIHHHRWPREQAIRWMIEHVGEQPVAARREIDRYCVYPGQACSFMVGATQLRALRESVRQHQGARFDVRDFHDLVLRSGPVPLDVLSAAMEQWT